MTPPIKLLDRPSILPPTLEVVAALQRRLPRALKILTVNEYNNIDDAVKIPAEINLG